MIFETFSPFILLNGANLNFYCAKGNLYGKGENLVGTCFGCPQVRTWMVVLRWVGEERSLAWITRIFVCDFNLGQFCHCRRSDGRPVQCSGMDDGQEKRRLVCWPLYVVVGGECS